MKLYSCIAICMLALTALTATIKPNSKEAFQDKLEGMLILGAYGDAQARVTEFATNIQTLKTKRPDFWQKSYQIYTYALPKIPDLWSIATSNYALFTDDTHMSLYLIHALLEYQSSSYNLYNILSLITKNFYTWSKANQIGRAPGKACMQNSAISWQSLLQNPLYNDFSRANGLTLDSKGLQTICYNKEGGSGAVMRAAATSVLFYSDPEFANLLSVAQGIITHTDSGSRAACAGFSAALLAVLQEESINDIWTAAITAAETYDSRGYTEPYNPKKYQYGISHFSKNGCAALCKQAQLYAKKGLSAKHYEQVLDEFRGWGATEALAAALYIFTVWNDDPYAAMSIAINRTPGDSDTIAKMVGELFGLQYGYKQLQEKFEQYHLYLEKERMCLEEIKDLPEYNKDFPLFIEQNIKTFSDLAHVLTNRYYQASASTTTPFE